MTFRNKTILDERFTFELNLSHGASPSARLSGNWAILAYFRQIRMD
jgi:hypothetical protein